MFGGNDMITIKDIQIKVNNKNSKMRSVIKYWFGE